MAANLQQQQPFKVIIAGGSVTGLMLANMLQRAGIDFELLEKREIAPQLGQWMFILPCTNLIRAQLSLEDPISQGAISLGVREHWDDKGKLFCSSDELIQLGSVYAIIVVSPEPMCEWENDELVEKSELTLESNKREVLKRSLIYPSK